jgi:hypothetical protein
VYARNNKAKNAKHMRCFPGCASAGHVASSFCGSSVSLVASPSETVPADLKACYSDPSLAFAIGYIVEMSQFGVCPYAVGQIVPYAEIHQAMHAAQPRGDEKVAAPSCYAADITPASDSTLRVVVAPHKRRIWRYDGRFGPGVMLIAACLAAP